MSSTPSACPRSPRTHWDHLSFASSRGRFLITAAFPASALEVSDVPLWCPSTFDTQEVVASYRVFHFLIQQGWCLPQAIWHYHDLQKTLFWERPSHRQTPLPTTRHALLGRTTELSLMFPWCDQDRVWNKISCGSHLSPNITQDCAVLSFLPTWTKESFSGPSEYLTNNAVEP